MVKLKNLVQNGNERLMELESQWKEVETPLINEYETLIGDATVIEVFILVYFIKYSRTSIIRVSVFYAGDCSRL